MSILWKDRKRIVFGLPWTFTRYTLTEEKLLIETGLLNKREEEVRLYRILDFTLKRPLGQRLWGLGTIHVCSADKSCPEFDICRIPDSRRVKELLSDQVESERERKRISGREFISADDDDDFEDDSFGH